MKVRVYSPYYPFPVTEGSHHVIFEQIRALRAAGHEVELLCWKDSPATLAQKIAKLPTGSFMREVRLVHLPRRVWPGWLDRAIRIGLSFLTQRASPELYYYPLTFRPRPTGPVDLAIYNFSFAYGLFLRSRDLPERRRIVYFHNLESELAAERTKGASPLARYLHARNARILLRHEREVSALADEAWFISPEDRDHHLAGAAARPRQNLRLVPPGFDPGLREAAKPAQERELVLGFLGRMDFKPNFDSAAWIVRELAPALQRQGFRGKVWLVGNGMPSSLAAEARTFPFIEVFGFLPSTEQFWSELDVLLCPHVSGSGVRIKLLEALARGIPAFTTAGGAARLHPDLHVRDDLFVSESADEWAARLKKQPKKPAQHGQFPDALDGRKIYAFLEPKHP